MQELERCRYVMLDILQTIFLLAYLAREIKDFSPGDLCYEKQVTCYSGDAKKLNLWNLRNLSEGGRVDAVDFLCAVLPQVLLSYSVRPCLWSEQLLSPSHLYFFRLCVNLFSYSAAETFYSSHCLCSVSASQHKSEISSECCRWHLSREDTLVTGHSAQQSKPLHC